MILPKFKHMQMLSHNSSKISLRPLVCLEMFFLALSAIVSSVTIFIVIFINAITRRKFIGILKGIGINGQIIEISYIFNQFLRSLWFNNWTFDFVRISFAVYCCPSYRFSRFLRWNLSGTLNTTLFRVGLLVVFNTYCRYIPARMIVRRNTLDSILGRNSKQMIETKSQKNI